LANRNENVVAILLEPMALNKEFIQWPLHITIVPWFHGYDARKLDDLLSGIAKAHENFWAVVGPLERFGQRKEVEVNVIDDCDKLTRLHWDVFNTLETNDFKIHQKDFVGDGYRAHITRQPESWKDKGEKVEIKAFALVKQERLKKTGEIVKMIVKQYELG
jgi:hypothetical protein